MKVTMPSIEKIVLQTHELPDDLITGGPVLESTRLEEASFNGSWSVFMLPIRTNNDIEAWHHGLNSRANNRVHLPFYLLVELLHQEARLVSIQIRLVSDGKLSRIQRKKYRLLQFKSSSTGKTLTATRFLPAAFSNSAVT